MYGDRPESAFAGALGRCFSLPVIVSWAAAALVWTILFTLPKSDSTGWWLFGMIALIIAGITIAPLYELGFGPIEALLIVGGVSLALVALLLLVGLWRREPILVAIAGHAGIAGIGFALFWQSLQGHAVSPGL
jgi:hypothetical protein